MNKETSEGVTWSAISTITIDGSLSDNISLIGFIESSLPSIVLQDGDDLIPDWTESPLTLVPVLHRINDERNLVQYNTLSRTWYRRTNAGVWAQVTSGQNGEVINATTGALTVSENKISAETFSCEYRFKCKYYDTETDKTLDYEMFISFGRIQNGEAGADGQPGQDGQDGQDGTDGIGIRSISQTKHSTEDEGENEWTVTLDDFRVSKFYVNNGSKGSAGTDGRNGWTRTIVYLYRRSSTPLTRADLDFGNLTYDVNTNAFLEAVGGRVGSWSTSTLVGNDPLYNTFVVIHTQADQVQVSPNNWATPVLVSEIGSSGQNGETVAYITLYQRADESPETPYNNLIYNFASHTISQPKDEHGEDLPWTLSIPTNNGEPLWAITAVAQSRDETDTILSSEWGDPIEIVRDGADGQDGQDGIDGVNGKDGADGKDGKDGTDGVDGQDGADGEDGKSAYEIAVEHGYSGTEEEWLLELHTEMRFQYAVVAGDYDIIRSYGPGLDTAYGYMNGVGYGLDVEWSDSVPNNVPEGSYVWLRAKNTYNDLWQYVRLTGKDGYPGGFGEPSASIIDEVGVPAVEITATGPNSAKLFHFTFRNLKGRGIDQIVEHWAVTATQEEPEPDEVILVDVPEMTPEYRWLWKKTTIIYTDTVEQEFVDLACIYGEKGEQGDGVTLSNIRYGVSNSIYTEPSVWSAELPAAPQGSYLWTKTTYSDNTQMLTYTYQPKDLNAIEIYKEYALSNSPLVLGEVEWSQSVAQDWYKGKYFWSREVHVYSDTSTTSEPRYEAELTAEFEAKCRLELHFGQKTFVSGINNLIPIDIYSNYNHGILTIGTTAGEFKYYDRETYSWTSFGSNLVIEISENVKLTDYVLVIPSVVSIGIITIDESFEHWNSETIESTDIIFQTGV